MAKPIVPPALLKAIAAVGATTKEPIPGAKQEASPIARLTERQSIRPARTAIAHQRGGNKGK